MAGFLESIPVHLFANSEIELIVIGASSLKFELNENRSILLYYYGATEDKEDWLYNTPLCGSDSLQTLAGQNIEAIVFKTKEEAEISFSNGKVLKIRHDNILADLINFRIGDEEYIA